MKTTVLIAWLGTLASTAVAAPARADDAAPSAPPTAPAPPAPTPMAPLTTPSPKRTLPDYRGADPPPPTFGEGALWVPRVILSPVYFTTEYLVRRPLGAVISAAERANIPNTLYDFFAFGPEHKAGIAPIVFVDFGFNPSIGLYGFWDDALVKGQDLRAHVSYWTDDWIGGSIVDRIKLGPKDSVQIKLLGVRRPDHVFYGIGPGSLQSAQSRYREDLLDGGVTFDFPMWRSSKIDAGAGVRAASFGDGHYGGDPGIVEAAAAGTFSLPGGFANGYTAEYNDLRFALDTRRPYPAEGSGVRIEVQGEQGSDVRQSPAAGWIHYGGGVGGFWDVNGYRRVISLSALTMFSDPLGGSPVPFTELVAMGGDIVSPGSFPAPMPGFFPGRLVDRSAAVATLRYKWPIGPWIAGSLQAAVGNVFGEHLEGFDTRLLRFSGAFGIESDSSPDSSFEMLIGCGSETFDHGGQIDSFRLAVGITRF